MIASPRLLTDPSVPLFPVLLLMERVGPLPTPHTSVTVALELMRHSGLRSLPVVDRGRRLVGTVLSIDCYASQAEAPEGPAPTVGALAAGSTSVLELPATPAHLFHAVAPKVIGELLRPPGPAVDIEEPAERAVETMIAHHLDCLAVVSSGVVVGIVRRSRISVAPAAEPKDARFCI